MNTPDSPSPLEIDAARTKSYWGAAVVVFLLYCLGFFPGLVANAMLLREARLMERRAGCYLPGVGALEEMRDLAMVLLAIGLVALVWIGYASRS